MGGYRQPGLIEAPFADTPFPKLRELQSTTEITPAALRAIVEKLGPQLEYLHLPGTPSDSLDALRPLVAGELYGLAYVATLTRPLWAVELPYEPNWPHFVRFPAN